MSDPYKTHPENAGLSSRARTASLAAVIVHMVGVGLTLGLTYPLTSLLLEARGVAPWLIGLAGGMTALAIVVLMPVLPRVVRGRSPVSVMICGCLLSALAIAVMPVFVSVEAWIALRFLMGAGLALPWLIGEIWLNRIAPESSRGRIIALYTAALFGGFAAGPVLLDFSDLQSWQPFLMALAALALAIVPLLPVAHLAPRTESERAGGVLEAMRRAPIVVAVALAAGFSGMSAFTLLPVYGVVRGLEQPAALYLLSSFLLGGLCLQGLIGWAMDRLPRNAVLCGLSFVACLLSFSFAFTGDRPAVLASLAFFYGGSVLGLYSLGLTILGERFAPVALPAANAAFLMTYEIGGVLGPILTGAAMGVAAAPGFAAGPGVVTAFLFLISLPGVLAFQRRRAAGVSRKRPVAARNSAALENYNKPNQKELEMKMNEQEKKKVYNSRPVVVAGATGGQGGAVARRLLERGHLVRGLTRNPDSDAARTLRDLGAEVVQADLNDQLSLERALVGAAAVFSVQDFLEAGVEAELRMGLNLAQVASDAQLEHIVYSGASTQDRNTGVPHLESKWRVEKRVRELGVPWTVFRPAAFMDNWAWDRERIERDGVLSLPLQPDTPYRQVAVADIAAMAVQAFEQPEKWISQVAPLTGDVATPLEIAEVFSRVMGREVRYEQLSWAACLAEQGEELTLMYRYFDRFGMDGEPRFLKRWAPEALSLEDYLRANGWQASQAAAGV